MNLIIEYNSFDFFSANKNSMKVAIIFKDDPLTNKTYTLRFNPMLSYLPSNGR